jgi:hypothetical protein
VFPTGDLGQVGLAPAHGLSLAFTLRSSDARNGYGVPGRSDLVALASDGRVKTGFGSHGGLGAWEQSPFLVADGTAVAPGSVTDLPSSILDIAPTALRHLSIDAPGLDGRALTLT